MAMVLKAGKTYTNPHNGDCATCYAVVDVGKGNKDTKVQVITLAIYKDEAARIAKREPINEVVHYVKDADFDTYFSVSALSTLGCNIYERAYVYLHALEDNAVLVYGDWEPQN